MSPFARFLVLLTLTASSAFAFTPALSVPQDLSKRDVNVGGGWPAKMNPCANGTGACNQVGSCCPESLFCKYNDPTAENNLVGTVCCAEGSNCWEELITTPFCADESWSLWSTTDGTNSFFCCPEGQIGDTSSNCNSNLTVIAASIKAVSVEPGHATKVYTSSGAGETTGVVKTTASGSSAASKTTDTAGATKTGDSLVGVVSSLLSKNSGSVHKAGTHWTGTGGLIGLFVLAL